MTSDGKNKSSWNGIRMHPLPFSLFALAAVLIVAVVIMVFA